ncbi:MAG: DoxX family protein, partial [Alphaproteobacteria bacterium]
IEEFVYYKLPPWLRDLVGILKVSFGIMLLMGIYDEKFKIIGAGGLSLLMIAALLTHVKVKNPIYKALPAVTLLSFSAIIIFSSLV